MVHEHAIIIKNSCTIDQINYLVQKANKLGKNGRDISHAYYKDDEEGSHIFFVVDEMKGCNGKIDSTFDR